MQLQSLLMDSRALCRLGVVCGMILSRVCFVCGHAGSVGWWVLAGDVGERCCHYPIEYNDLVNRN